VSQHRLLGTTLTVGPNRHPNDQVKDAEAFCRHYLDTAFDGWGMYLRPDDYDESLSLLITQLWRLNETFDRERNDCFANYARSIISRRAADVGPRRILGRNGNKISDYLYDDLDESTQGSRPDEALTHQPGHQDPDRREYPGWLPTDTAGREAWAARLLGVRTPELAP